MTPLPYSRFAWSFATLGICLAAAPLKAADDTPPVDPKPLLQALRAIREQQNTLEKGQKQRFIQEASAAAANPARAVELWEQSIQATQFQGAAKDSGPFREWKEKDGDALKDKEVQSALHLYFSWLSITLQRANGVEMKTLLPAVMNYARELQADQAVMDNYDENLRKEKEALQNGPRKLNPERDREKQRDHELTKRMHDGILKGGLSGSPFAQWVKISDILNEVGTKKRENEEGSTGWEASPGNLDGIYQTIIQPELRAAKNPLVVDYWDTKLRRETEQASKNKVTFEIDKFNQLRRPQLLWGRSKDLLKVGMKNRAVSEMFTIIKANPSHPDADNWMNELEGVLAAPAAPTASPGVAAAAAVSSAPQAPVPSATPAPLPAVPAAAVPAQKVPAPAAP